MDKGGVCFGRRERSEMVIIISVTNVCVDKVESPTRMCVLLQTQQEGIHSAGRIIKTKK